MKELKNEIYEVTVTEGSLFDKLIDLLVWLGLVSEEKTL